MSGRRPIGPKVLTRVRLRSEQTSVPAYLSGKANLNEQSLVAKLAGVVASPCGTKSARHQASRAGGADWGDRERRLRCVGWHELPSAG